MNFIKSITALFFLLVIAGSIQAQEYGFDILTIGPGTKALGLNEATTAALLGASDIYSNPANLVLEPSSGFNADYSLWVSSLTNSHLSVHFRKERSSLAFGILTQSADDFELRDRPGPSQGDFTVSYFSLAGAYAYRIGRFSAGATIQYLREEIYIYNASGYAVNAGISSEWVDRDLRVSAALLNIGKMDELNNEVTTLPSRFKAGLEATLARFNFPGNEELPLGLTIFADYIVPFGGDDSGNSTNTGEESYGNIALSLEIAEALSLYSGYKTGDQERPISFGSELSIEGIDIYYSLTPFRTGFGTAHSIGLRYRF